MIDKDTRLIMETVVNEARKQARWLWLRYVKAAVQLGLLAIVLTIEFELLYRTFQAIAGKDNQYWSPALMAMTGIIMVSAFHLLARLKADNAALKLIQRAAPWLIGVYLVGLGLLTSGIVGMDAGGLLLEPPEIIIGVLPSTGAPPEQHWLTVFFENISNPLALMLFAFGIGGLAIVNLFVAHALLHRLQKDVRIIRDVKGEADRLNSEYRLVEAACKRYRELQHDLHDINLWSEGRITHEAAQQIALIIHEGSSKHRRFIKRRDIAPPPGLLSLSDPVDPKVIERELKKIEALDCQTITKLLQSQPITFN